MFNPVYYENSRSDGCGVLEILGGCDGETSGQGDVSHDAGRRRFVPMQKSLLCGEISGPLASLNLTQIFHYSASQCDKTVEAAYRFPLPGDAAVTGVTVRFGDVVIAAELKSRADADAAYADAKEEGRQAALTSRESPDVFTLLVAGIQPDQPIEVETRYVQLARSTGTGWTIRIPLTTPPRYLRADELGSAPARGQPLLALHDPGHRFQMEITVDATDDVSSPTHELTNTKDGDTVTITLAAGEVTPDRDCVLAWQLRRQAEHPMLDVHTHIDRISPPAKTNGIHRHDDQIYFLAAVAPPLQLTDTPSIPSEMILLVDHSGSMTGAKWAAADWAVERFVGELQPHDHFALGIFHTYTRWFTQATEAAEGTRIQAAIEWMQSDKESGGTELGIALEQALALPRTDGDIARHVLIITDAAVTDAARILRLVDDEAQRAKAPRRISVLCIDAAPNAYLANAMAEQGGGVARFLTSAPEERDIATALDEMLTIWAEPQLLDLRLEVDRGEISGNRRPARGSEAEWSYLDLGDLTAGQPVWVNGRAPAAGRDRLTVRLVADDDEPIAVQQIELTDTHPRPALKALFGARRINELEFLIHADYDRATLVTRLDQLGYDGAAIMGTTDDQLYTENRRKATTDAVRTLLLQEALNYGLLSIETSFVAIRSEAGKRIEVTVPVANALPAGWSGQELAGGSRAGTRSTGTAPPGIGPAAGPPQMPPSFGASMGAPVMASPPQLMPMPQPSSSFGQGPLPAEHELTIFSGAPQLDHGSAVLFDTSDDDSDLPVQTTFTQVRMEYDQDEGTAYNVNRTAKLLIFVGDLAEPRATVRMLDLLRYGTRPLNLRRGLDDVVRIELVDAIGTHQSGTMVVTMMFTIK